jgi:hypothetical protein
MHVRYGGRDGTGAALAYLYIDKVLNELRDELLSAMHSAVQSELRGGRVDVPRLYRAFTRAAAKQMANPVQVSDKCMEVNGVKSKKGSKVKDEA